MRGVSIDVSGAQCGEDREESTSGHSYLPEKCNKLIEWAVLGYRKAIDLGGAEVRISPESE